MKLRRLVDHLGDNLRKVNIDDQEVSFNSVQCDSRLISKGDIFVAVKGAELNGEEFILQSLDRGASLIVAESTGPEVSLQVKNSYKALSSAAELKAGFPAEQIQVNGITGTNGKSSTAFILEHILCYSGKKTGVIGTIHNRYGSIVEKSTMTTPDAIQLQNLYLRMLQEKVETAVVEVSSHALVQHRLGTVPVNTAIFTNLSQDHLDYHGDMKAYFTAKKKLFDEFLHADGCAIINVDDEAGKQLYSNLDRVRKIAVGKNGDICLGSVAAGGESTEFSLTGQVEMRVKVPLIGNFNIMNTALAAVAAVENGVEPAVIEKALLDFPGVPGRMELFKGKNGCRVFVDYAHTPDALLKVLKTLKPYAGRLICLFGCGGDRDKKKRPLMAQAAESFADEIIVTDDNPRSEDPEAIIADITRGFKSSSKVYYERDRYRAIEYGISRTKKEDIFLVAGKGHEDYQIYGHERKFFCDRSAVKKILEAKSA